MRSVGVGVFIKKDFFFLIGQRSMKCKRGPGCFALPGGMIEKHETIEKAAIREVYEETGLLVDPINIHRGSSDSHIRSLLGVSDHLDTDRVHLEAHLTFWIAVKYVSGDPKVREPDKCMHWNWVTMTQLEGFLNTQGNLSKEQNFWTPMSLWRDIYPYSR